MVAAAIRRAVAACGLPEGVFGHVTGAGNEIGTALVQDPRIAAVGFTGSRGGGLALAKLAQARPVPDIRASLCRIPSGPGSRRSDATARPMNVIPLSLAKSAAA